jgi:hypothetical protein
MNIALEPPALNAFTVLARFVTDELSVPTVELRPVRKFL